MLVFIRFNILLIVMLAFALPSAFLGSAKAADWKARPSGFQFEKPAICPIKISPRHGYKVCQDQTAILETALNKARHEGKLLIVKFGADWCPWCRKLHKLMPSKQVLGYKKDNFGYQEKFALVEIATSTSAGGKGVVKLESGSLVSDTLLEQLRVDKSRVKGIPYLVIIDPFQPGKGIFRRSKYLETRFMGLFYHYKGISYEPYHIRTMLKKAWKDLRGINRKVSQQERNSYSAK